VNIIRFPNMTSISEATTALVKPGDLSLIVRDDTARWMIMRCPDGCGELLKINLDPRSGKAWRVYEDEQDLSLYPSIWRDSGCESHFIIWRNYIWMCGSRSESLGESKRGLRAKLNILSKGILRILNSEPTAYHDLAEHLEANPWDVQAACERLAKRNRVRLVETDDGTKVVAGTKKRKRWL